MGTAEGAAATETQEAEQRTPLTLTIGGKELRTALDRTGKAIRGLNTGRRGETASNRVRVGIHRDAEGRGTGYIQMEAADETAKVRTPIGIEEAGKAGRSEGDGWAEIGGAILRETAAAARGRIRITAPPPETEPLPGTLGLSTGEPAFGFLTAEVVGRYGPEPERRTEPGEAQGRNRNRIRLGMHTLEQELQRAAGGFRSLWITTYPGRDGVEADAVFRAYEAAHGNPRYYRSRTARVQLVESPRDTPGRAAVHLPEAVCALLINSNGLFERTDTVEIETAAFASTGRVRRYGGGTAVGWGIPYEGRRQALEGPPFAGSGTPIDMTFPPAALVNAARVEQGAAESAGQTGSALEINLLSGAVIGRAVKAQAWRPGGGPRRDSGKVPAFIKLRTRDLMYWPGGRGTGEAESAVTLVVPDTEDGDPRADRAPRSRRASRRTVDIRFGENGSTVITTEAVAIGPMVQVTTETKNEAG